MQDWEIEARLQTFEKFMDKIIQASEEWDNTISDVKNRLTNLMEMEKNIGDKQEILFGNVNMSWTKMQKLMQDVMDSNYQQFQGIYDDIENLQEEVERLKKDKQ
jgi:uncharacterized protein Yka (UPF0111/DUF47 family)